MYEIVEKLMESRGVKASDVSKATGIPSSVFTDWRKGRYTPKADKLFLLARYFGVPMEVFFEDPKNIKHKPLYDVAAGQGRINDDFADEYVEEEEEVEEGYSWCRIVGDSMYPILHDGDKVKVRHQTQTEPTDLTVVKVDGESATVKYVEVTDNGVWLRAENKEVFADRFYTVSEVLTLPITIIGKVVQMQRTF